MAREVTGSDSVEVQSFSGFAFITARIIASLDFISAVQYMIHFICPFISNYPIHTEIFAPKSNEINFIPVRDCWFLVGRFLSLVKNIVRPITGHGRLFVTSEENRRALSVFSQRLASNGELFFISRQIKWHQDLRI